MPPLGPESAHIFRITHVRNVPWILDNGLHCRASKTIDPNFISIGSAELIDKRSHHPVPIAPFGTLDNYVPFYFTQSSIMLLNIKSGRNGVTQRPNREIAILVSSLHRLRAMKSPFVFTNGHAYMKDTDYFDDLANLGEIDWDLLRKRDFKRDDNDPGKLGRNQAEALIPRHVPVEGLIGIGCYDAKSVAQLTEQVAQRSLKIPVQATPGWYF